MLESSASRRVQRFRPHWVGEDFIGAGKLAAHGASEHTLKALI